MKTGENVRNLGLGNDFLNKTSKGQTTKEKTITFDFIKIKKIFWATKNTIKKVKRRPTEWEKISANHMSNKGLLSRIHS